MNSDQSDTQGRSFSKIVQQLLLGLFFGLLMISTPLIYWIFPNNSPLSPLQIIILIVSTIMPGIFAAIWGKSFIDQLTNMLDSIT